MKVLLIISFTYLHQAYAGVIRDNIKESWNKKISVCWLDDTTNISDYFVDRKKTLELIKPSIKKKWKDQYKSIVKKTINDNFTLTEAGIAFTGWDSCQRGHNKVALIMGSANRRDTIRDLKMPKLKGISTVYHSDKPIIFIRKFTEVKRTPTRAIEVLKLISLHEFAHAAGLKHEFINREENLTDNNINQCQFARENWGPEPREPNTLRVTDYDGASVMNKCFVSLIHKKLGTTFSLDKTHRRFKFSDSSIVQVDEHSEQAHVNIQLSLGDIHALKCLWRFNDLEKKKFCHQDFKPWNRSEPSS